MDFKSQITSIKQLAEKYDYFFLDCDGVIWSGTKAIDQAFEVLTWLVGKGKRVFFISNSSGKTRAEYCNKIQEFGFKECTTSLIYGSAFVTASYVKEQYPEISKVRVVGMNSIKKEFKEQGIESIGGEDDEGFENGIMTMEQFEKYEVDPEVKAVVVGLDTKFTYAKLCIANLYIQTGGARFIATNNDAYDIVGNRRQPAASSMIEAIKHTIGDTSRESIEPEVIGKPNPYVVGLIMRQHGIADSSKIVMIGDRLDTDVHCANQGGIDSCVVFTGVTRNEEDIQDWVKRFPEYKPTYIMRSFGILE